MILIKWRMHCTKLQKPPTGWLITNALTNQFWNISVLAVMKPFPKYKGGWGVLKVEERDNSKGVVETHKQWSSVERSKWRQCGRAHCGYSAGTQCGRSDANYWSAAKDLSPCSAFPLFARNSTMSGNALPPAPTISTQPATRTPPHYIPLPHFTLILSFSLTCSLQQAQAQLWRTINEGGGNNERGVNFRTLRVMLPKISHSYIFQHPSGWLGVYGLVCVCAGPPSLGCVRETMGPVS